MSANNGIIIDYKTLKVYYQGCWDNELEGAKLIGKGKDFDEAYKIAREWADENEYFLEYGIQVING